MRVTGPHRGDDFDVALSGSGGDPLVVLIHGSLDRSGGMAKVARIVSRFAEVARFDRRGYGDRWEHDGPFTVEGNVEDVLAIIGDRRAILVGHSFGGQIALATAARLADQIVGVSTYETPLSWLAWWPNDTAGSIGVAAGPELAAESFMVRLIGRDRWERLPERTKNERRREGRALSQELSTLRDGPSWRGEDITCPTLCAMGSEAPDRHRRAVSWLVDQIPNATAVVIDGAGHGAHMSHPEEFVDQLVGPHLRAVGTFTEIS